MRTLIATLFLLLPLCTVAQGQDARKAFKLCESEAFMSLSSGRLYLLHERNAAAVLDYLSSSSEVDKGYARETFDELDADRGKTPAQVATYRLTSCAERTKSGFDRPRYAVETCFASAEVALFVHMAVAASSSREAVVAQVEKWMPDRGQAPTSLIELVALSLYPASNPAAATREARKIFWNCVYP